MTLLHFLKPGCVNINVYCLPLPSIVKVCILSGASEQQWLDHLNVLDHALWRWWLDTLNPFISWSLEFELNTEYRNDKNYTAPLFAKISKSSTLWAQTACTPHYFLGLQKYKSWCSIYVNRHLSVRGMKTSARKCSYLRSLRTLPDQPVPLQRARPIVVKAGWDVLDRIALLLSLFLLLAQLHSSGAPACGADHMLRCH